MVEIFCCISEYHNKPLMAVTGRQGEARNIGCNRGNVDIPNDLHIHTPKKNIYIYSGQTVSIGLDHSPLGTGSVYRPNFQNLIF